jgi:hypothetical protein
MITRFSNFAFNFNWRRRYIKAERLQRLALAGCDVHKAGGAARFNPCAPVLTALGFSASIKNMRNYEYMMNYIQANGGQGGSLVSPHAR